MLHTSIQSRLQAAVSAILPGADVSSVLVRPCPDPKFGDYQSNALMALAKERKAELVTGDEEFKQVEKEIKINWLKLQKERAIIVEVLLLMLNLLNI